MASEHDIIHRQLIPIKDLPTRSVTIYPSRAAVVRDIENIEIKVSISRLPALFPVPGFDVASGPAAMKSPSRVCRCTSTSTV